FLKNIPALQSGNTAGGPLLGPPLDRPSVLSVQVPEIALAELLKAANCSLDYRNVDFVDDRSRSVGYGPRYNLYLGWEWWAGTLREARFVLELNLRVTAPQGAPLTQPIDFAWRYVHPEHHIDGFVYDYNSYFSRFGTNREYSTFPDAGQPL